MFFKQIESKGLAHFSYMVGDKGRLAVIDPRRDVEIYLEEARNAGMVITHILETHRNEDYIVGSMELQEKTGATVLLSGHEELGHVYGTKIYDGHMVDVGGLRFQALHTPGHTRGHLSFALYEEDRPSAFMVFTGDSLFMGDLARTDFYGEEALEEMTGLLYDSIFEKLLPLGEDVLLFPAHGAGSACGESMEDRPFSTLGYESRYNPELQDDTKEAFIERFGKMRVRPRYFDRMREFNVKGAPHLGGTITLKPLRLKEVESEGITLIDCRSKEAFFGGHIHGSLYVSKDNLSVYLGTMLELETPIAFLVEGTDMEELAEIYWQARRIGFDNIRGFVADGPMALQLLGKDLKTLSTISSDEFRKLSHDYVLLDIRRPVDIDPEDPKENRIIIPLQLLDDDFEQLPKDKPIYILCNSGTRSASAASMLENRGYEVYVLSGGVLTLEDTLEP